MKCYLYIALVVFLGGVAVQGYGTKRYHKHHESNRRLPHKSHHVTHHEPLHGSPNAPSHGTQHGSAHGSHHRPSHDHRGALHGNSRPPSPRKDSPEWYDRRDPWDSGDDSYSYGSDSGSSGRYEPSDEDYGDWYDYFPAKRPCKRPTKKPAGTASTPLPTTISHTPPNTKGLYWTQATVPPNTANPRPEPTPTGTTWSMMRPAPTPTTTQFTPRPLKTVGPTPSTTGKTESISRSTRTPWHPTTPTEDTTHWETSTSIPETTTEAEEEFTTLSPEVLSCIELCPSTPEYNPVCGSNGETFLNEGKLFCASSCGVNVSLQRRSVCPPPIFDGEDDGPPPPPPRPPTTTTSPTIMGRTTSLSDFHRCMRQCHITPFLTPVCGTDLVTYMNMDRLRCAQSCGEDVEVLCEKPCPACQFKPVTLTTTTIAPTTTRNVRRSTTKPDLEECIEACPMTPENNPVCGTDGVTYKNPGHLLCAQLCGVDVRAYLLSPCSPTTTSSSTTTFSTTSSSTTTALSPDVLNCIRRCPVTSQYDPVCGTDDLTYTNLGNLECSQFCGLGVELKHKSRCFDEFNLGTDGTDITPSETTQSINGNKEEVTTSSQSIATTTSLFTSPTTTRTTTPVSTSTLGFTIPPDVLNNIFGSTTQSPPITKVTSSDDDEDVDLDVRYNKNDAVSKSDNSRIIFPE